MIARRRARDGARAGGGRAATPVPRHVAAGLAVALVGCGGPLGQARLTDDEPTRPEEAEAAARLARAPCSGAWGLLFPGLGQLCTGRTGEGATLAALGAAELGVALAVATGTEAGIEHPGAAVPLVAFQDLWLYGYVATLLDEQRARRLRYVPPERLGELVRAPFDPAVLRHPDVWAGLAGMVAVGLGVSALAGERLRTDRIGDDPNLFGRTFRPAVGYPLAAAVGTGLFTHVAVAEEIAFRGWLQSAFARSLGETSGWALGSAVFGASHALNALLLAPERRARYLALAVPTITALGGYIGLSYRWHGYRLGPPVALHFWYDLLVSAAFFLSDPQGSPLAASVALPF